MKDKKEDDKEKKDDEKNKKYSKTPKKLSTNLDKEKGENNLNDKEDKENKTAKKPVSQYKYLHKTNEKDNKDKDIKDKDTKDKETKQKQNTTVKTPHNNKIADKTKFTKTKNEDKNINNQEKLSKDNKEDETKTFTLKEEIKTNEVCQQNNLEKQIISENQNKDSLVEEIRKADIAGAPEKESTVSNQNIQLELNNKLETNETEIETNKEEIIEKDKMNENEAENIRELEQ